jgi:hypothetical protein
MIFDKSVLQALSLDEAVWLDNFYLADITRPFLVEMPHGPPASARPSATLSTR